MSQRYSEKINIKYTLINKIPRNAWRKNHKYNENIEMSE